MEYSEIINAVADRILFGNPIDDLSEDDFPEIDLEGI